MSEEFNFEALIQMLEVTGANVNAIPYKSFTRALVEFSKAFSYFGSALSFAFSDITSKAAIVVSNFQDSGKFDDLQSMILDEISRGIEQENTEEYRSTARSVLRLMWFLDFLISILELAVDDGQSHLATLVRHAYEIALAPHHNLALKTAARIAIRYTPEKDTFIARMLGAGKTWEEYKELLRKLTRAVSPIRDALWEFYRGNSIEDLP